MSSTQSPSTGEPLVAPPRRRPTLVPPPLEQPAPWKALVPLLLLTLLPRLLAFAFTENIYGDSVVRTDLALRWANHPHVITSFKDGAFQFGPLHLYLVGLALKLGLAKLDAGRWVSLFVGTFSVAPLYLLTSRLFDYRAAIAASVAFALWGLHIQLSSTAASESLAIFLTLCMLWQLQRALDDRSFAPVAVAAVFTNLACAVRYDAWMFIPILSAALLFQGRDRVANATRAVLYALMSLPFALLWMHGNELATGSALFPIHFIDDFHRAWAVKEIAWTGEARFRLQGLLFWPGAAIVTLSPLVGALGMVGMARAAKLYPTVRWLVVLAVVPTLYYAFRAAVLLSFVPLARFTVCQLVLLLPFVLVGLEAFSSERLRRGVLALALVLAVAFPVALSAFTFQREGRLEDALRPVSPVTTNSRAIREASDFARSAVKADDDSVILDVDGDYRDLQVAFFSTLAEQNLARYRWKPEDPSRDDPKSFEARLHATHPRALILSEKGALSSDPRFFREGDLVRFDGRDYHRVSGSAAPLLLFAAD